MWSITTLHKYIYIGIVKEKHKEAILMYGCYVEVVFNVEVIFNFVAKARHHPNLVPVGFQFSYISLHTLSFKKMFFIILL